MLALFRMPETATTCDLRLLDEFIATVQASPLSVTTKDDAVKVLQCLRWVKANLDNIETFIDNKTDYLPDLPAVDQKNGVIHDHLGSSLHFNAYASGAKAASDLAALVQTVESGFDHLRTWGPLALWSAIAKFNDDKDRGCLEARVAPFTECLGALESTHGLCQLEDVLQVCQLLYFLSIDDDTYNFLLADEFFSPHYGQTVLYQGVPVELTEALLFDAMVDMLAYTKPTEAALAEAGRKKQTEPQQWQTYIFQELSRKATVVQGQQGMIQYRFNTEEEAKQYATWLKQQSTLQSHHIDRCNVKHEKDKFVVRLSAPQFETLTGSTAAMSTAASSPPNTASLGMNRSSVITRPSVSPPSAVDEMGPDALCAHTQGCPTLLHWAAYQQKSAAFQALINKASKHAINQALVMVDKSGSTPLYWAAEKQDSTAFQALVNKASEDAISQALLMVNTNGDTPLHWAAAKQDSTAFQALINKASKHAINQALVMASTSGITPLYWAAEKQDSTAFQALVNKASKGAINQALVMVDNYGDTPLYWAAEKQDSTAFQALVNKASEDAINRALVMVDNYGDTPLHWVIKNQNPEAFEILLDKASRSILGQILSGVDEQMLFSAHSLDDLRPWIVVLLKIAGRTERLPPLNTREGIDACIPLLLSSLKTIKAPKATRLGRHLALCLLTLQNQDTLNVTLGDGSLIPLNSPELITNIETHGLRDLDDYHRLKTIAASRPEATALHDLLGLIEQCHSLKPQPSAEELRIHQTLNEGLLLVKTFTGWQPQAWTDFLNQLNTPDERAILRKPLGTVHTPFKFTHLTAEIAPYAGKKPRPKDSHQTHAKKQSATLISPQKNTPLFQSQHEDLPLVGIACCADPHLDDRHYDPAKAKLRALLEYDTGTYGRPWRGNETEVQAYAAKTKNYTSLEAFRTAVAKNTKKTNEVLMQPSRGSLLGIVLGEETPKAIKLAYQYQRDVYKTLGLILPIIYYNAKTHTLILNWEKKTIWENPSKTKAMFCRSLIYQAYVQAIERLGAYYGAPKPFDSSERKTARLGFFSKPKPQPPQAAIISTLVKQHVKLLKDNPMERTLPALLTELEALLRAHGETIDPTGPLSACLRDIQASLPTPIIDIDRLNASMMGTPAAGRPGI